MHDYLLESVEVNIGKNTIKMSLFSGFLTFSRTVSFSLRSFIVYICISGKFVVNLNLLKLVKMSRNHYNSGETRLQKEVVMLPFSFSWVSQ